MVAKHDPSSLTSQVLAVIAEIQPCTTDDVWKRGFPHEPRDKIARAINKLSTKQRITRTTASGQIGIYTTEVKPLGIEIQPAPAPVIKRIDNLTPGRTHHTSEVYHAINWRLSMPLRPGALDHEKHPSLRAGVRVPYAPAVLTIQGGRR